MAYTRSLFVKKRFIIPLVILSLLVAGRFYLSTYIKNTANQALAEIPGYYGKIDDIDLQLIRGFYTIEGLVLDKVEAETRIPFLYFPKSEVKIQWRPLLKGEIVSELSMYSPEIKYVLEDQSGDDDEADRESWTKALTELVPISINQLEVYSGQLAFKEISAEPEIDLKIEDLRLSARNLQNVEQEEAVLPSPIELSGISFGGGKINVKGDINLIKQIPDLDLNASLEDVDATALNALVLNYVGVDFEEGKVNLFSEFAIKDAYLKGYVKPLLENYRLIGKDENIAQQAWEALITGVGFLFTNQRTGKFATNVPFEGDLSDVDSNTWKAVWGIIKNAYIESMESEIDESISFSDFFDSDEEGEDKDENEDEDEDE
ncbi:MAG: DUF748 domain-containing protein [Cyclobacteriaceae bacterium]|nr:DUF748 domain-containing protein [Cyclobacteriaceae bacterium]MCH8517152.1 DUF748 domain-containing protein [Cyclobacteriaceae bacterium]